MGRIEMLWYKTWLDTRWRFLIGFIVLLCMAVGVVLNYSFSAQLIDRAGRDPNAYTTNALLQDVIRVEQTYRGFVWYQWFRNNMAQMGTFMAVLLGTGGLYSNYPGGVFTLSLPASRNQWLVARAATGLG